MTCENGKCSCVIPYTPPPYPATGAEIGTQIVLPNFRVFRHREWFTTDLIDVRLSLAGDGFTWKTPHKIITAGLYVSLDRTDEGWELTFLHVNRRDKVIYRGDGGQTGPIYVVLAENGLPEWAGWPHSILLIPLDTPAEKVKW